MLVSLIKHHYHSEYSDHKAMGVHLSVKCFNVNTNLHNIKKVDAYEYIHRRWCTL